ncbi:MAG: ABC transporter ATP-binding protein [Tannerella sp.]|jgi:iron complex transport system ATP-binding protein|nr:ABC transporter ATP-binding protein [Tannerella sp.]
MDQLPVIETKSLSIGYLNRKMRKVVHEALNLQLYPGRLTSLLGLNGAGKSTLLRTICGFQPPLGGDICLMGKPLRQYTAKEISRITGAVLTEKTNAGGITVWELVSLGRHPYTGFFGVLHASDRLIIDESIQAAGIGHKAQNYVSELSDGERQKAMIAKVLAQQCPIIVLDEPTAFLDVISRMEVMGLLHRLASEQHKAILVSTHDLDLAIQESDCLWLQQQGRSIVCGSPEDLILNGEMESFFHKKDVSFDCVTGKLKIAHSFTPIGVEGDSTIAHWIGNALIRNGFNPSSVSPDRLNVNCTDSGRMILSAGNQILHTVKSIDELVCKIKNLAGNNVK